MKAFYGSFQTCHSLGIWPCAMSRMYLVHALRTLPKTVLFDLAMTQPHDIVTWTYKRFHTYKHIQYASVAYIFNFTALLLEHIQAFNQKHIFWTSTFKHIPTTCKQINLTFNCRHEMPAHSNNSSTEFLLENFISVASMSEVNPCGSINQEQMPEMIYIVNNVHQPNSSLQN